MIHANDPFEQFKARREVERLENKVRSSATVPCPGEPASADEKPSEKRPKPVARPIIDASRAWIY